MNDGNRQHGTRSDCFPKEARGDATVSNYTWIADGSGFSPIGKRSNEWVR